MKAMVFTNNQNKFANYTEKFTHLLDNSEYVFINKVENFVEMTNQQSSFEFCIVDSSMSTIVLNDCLKTIKDIAGERPLVICGDEEDQNRIDKSIIADTKFNISISNPEDEEKIKSVVSFVKKNLGENKQEEALARKGMDFVAIKVRNLFFVDKMPYNLYIKISSEKHVLAIEKESEISTALISKLIKRKINFLYIEKDKHIHFLEISMLKAKTFLNANTDINKKLIMAHLRSTALLHDYLFNVGVTTPVELFIETLVNNMVKSLNKTHMLMKVLSSFQFNQESNIGKSVLCSYISFYLTQSLGWKSESISRKFIMASLIQDLYLENDDLAKLKSPNDPNLVKFTEDEIKSFMNHTEKISAVALQLSKFPDLEFILRQHHETANRDGFPNKTSPSELQLAVCTFNISTQLALELNVKGISKEVISKTYKSFVKDHNNGNFKQPILHLRKILNL